jgi:hypothetical protein
MHLVLALASDSYEFTGKSHPFRRMAVPEPKPCKAVPELTEAMSERDAFRADWPMLKDHRPRRTEEARPEGDGEI